MAENWLVDVRKYAANADESVVAAIVKYCGISLQSRDSSLVAMSDKKERELVRENYLKKKLGLTSPDAELDAAVVSVGQVMKADRTKNRVTVYYLLAEHFDLLGIFGGSARGPNVAASGALAAAAGAAIAGAAGASGDAASVAASSNTGSASTIASASPAAPMALRSDTSPAASANSAGGNPKQDDFNLFGWGCGAIAVVVGAIILAALLAWWISSRSPAEPDASSVPVAVAPAAAPAPAPAPAPVAQVIPDGAGVTTGERNGKPMLTVYFDTGKSDVTNDLATAAAAVKNYVANNTGAKLAVSGFNDPTGNAAANAELSKNRAQAVGKALEGAGIPAAAIEFVKPEAATDTQADMSNARRVEVVAK